MRHLKPKNVNVFNIQLKEVNNFIAKKIPILAMKIQNQKKTHLKKKIMITNCRYRVL